MEKIRLGSSAISVPLLTLHCLLLSARLQGLSNGSLRAVLSPGSVQSWHGGSCEVQRKEQCIRG